MTMHRTFTFCAVLLWVLHIKMNIVLGGRHSEKEIKNNNVICTVWLTIGKLYKW